MSCCPNILSGIVNIFKNITTINIIFKSIKDFFIKNMIMTIVRFVTIKNVFMTDESYDFSNL